MPTLVSEKVTKAVSFGLSAADAVWIATAMLHERYPDAPHFQTAAIVAEVLKERLTEAQERTVYQHVTQHCVANRPPKPNRPRMLLALGEGRRRLFIPGDKEDPGRAGAPYKPAVGSLPAELQHWLRWYDTWSLQRKPNKRIEDPLLALIGSGKDIWADEHADEYVRRLREEW